MTRRIAGSSTNSPQKTGKGLAYDWECMVTINPEPDNVSAEDIGNTIAAKFSQFESEAFKRQRFELNMLTGPEKKEMNPVNYFLLDDDVLTLLRIVYSEATKEDLMADDDVMMQFFGSATYGRKFLGSLNELKWELVLDAVV